MDDRCEAAHARLLSGTCPWCGQPVFNGRAVEDPLGSFDIDTVLAKFTETQIGFSESEVVGPTLKQLIDQHGPLDLQLAALYIAKVALQLAELHKAQQIHRNVRPDNIYLGPDQAIELRNEVPKSTRASLEEWALTAAGYMAPEQAIHAQVDDKADIYSLGCTFYFLLTGRSPFDEGSVAERLLRHQTQTPAPIETHRPDAPRALSDLIRRMLAKKPTERPTAIDVATTLDAWLAENG